AKVTAILEGPAVVVDGAVVPASAVIVAVPHGQAAAIVPAGAAPGKDGWQDLGASPIVNVHAVYDRTVTGLPHAAAVGSPVRGGCGGTGVAGRRAGQSLSGSVSAAQRWIDLPTAAMRAEFVPALERLFPAARQARLTDFFVTRERRATFFQGPGSGAR